MGQREDAAAGLAALIGAFALVSCVSVGEPFPVEPLIAIAIGETTQAEVRSSFGEPWRTGLENGQLTWTYGHYRYTLFGPAQTRDLVIRFDENDVVVSYTFNTTSPGDLER